MSVIPHFGAFGRSFRSFSLRFIGCAIVAAVLAGCAQQPQGQGFARSAEYFPESKYGPASQRVADGDDIPKGGGQYLIGKPYAIAGKTYAPSEKKVTQVGMASWYGDAFHGRKTANGEIYDKNAITAAHPTMPLPSYARVTNLRNQRSIIVRVNDRGPYHGGRVMDLSARAADALDYKAMGVAKIRIEYIGKASLHGSDDKKLLATLRTDGQLAQLEGVTTSPTRVAEQQIEPRAPQPVAAYRAAALRPALKPDDEPTQPLQAPVSTAASASAVEMPQEVPLPPVQQASNRPVPLDEDENVTQKIVTSRASLAAAPLPPSRPFSFASVDK